MARRCIATGAPCGAAETAPVRQAKALLREHRALLDEIALYLLQKETITGDEFMVYVNAENRKLEAPKDEAEASDAEAAPAEDAADKTDENPNPTEGA